MKYRAIGKSGLRVSVLGLGSWLTYGGSSIPDQQAVDLVHRAYDLGINYFDTANVYQGGAAERLLAKALTGIPRASVVLATKAFWPVGPGPNDRGLSRKHLVESVNRSLERLNTDYLDVFFCHRFDAEVPLEETLSTLDQLVRAGKILYVGVSEWTAAQMERAVGLQVAHGWEPIRVSQPRYNLLHRDIETEVIPTSERAGIGQVVWSPLAEGFLTGKYREDAPPPADSRRRPAPRIQHPGLHDTGQLRGRATAGGGSRERRHAARPHGARVDDSPPQCGGDHHRRIAPQSA